MKYNYTQKYLNGIRKYGHAWKINHLFKIILFSLYFLKHLFYIFQFQIFPFNEKSPFYCLFQLRTSKREKKWENASWNNRPIHYILQIVIRKILKNKQTKWPYNETSCLLSNYVLKNLEVTFVLTLYQTHLFNKNTYFLHHFSPFWESLP